MFVEARFGNFVPCVGRATAVFSAMSACRRNRRELEAEIARQRDRSAAGTRVTVTLWQASIAQIADWTRVWITKDSPIYRASNDVAALTGTLDRLATAELGAPART